MLNPIYNLPEIRFVGGESQSFLFHLTTPSGRSYDASECDVDFAIIHYVNKNGKPVLSKTASLLVGKSGLKNIARVDLSPEDTLYLYGRYIYQITVKDMNGAIDIPGQGIVDIVRNIHKEYIAN